VVRVDTDLQAVIVDGSYRRVTVLDAGASDTQPRVCTK
jgi:hypothetical protein